MSLCQTSQFDSFVNHKLEIYGVRQTSILLHGIIHFFITIMICLPKKRINLILYKKVMKHLKWAIGVEIYRMVLLLFSACVIGGRSWLGLPRREFRGAAVW